MLSWRSDGGLRGFFLSRNPGLSNATEYGAGEFPLPTRATTRTGAQTCSKPASMIRAQQTEKAYPDISRLRRELENTQRERDRATLDRGQAALDRDQAVLDRNKAVLERDKMRAELEQTRKVQETTANRDQLKLELKRWQQEVGRSSKKRKASTPIEPLMGRLRPESQMEVDETPSQSDWLLQSPSGGPGTNERRPRDVEPSGTHAVLERSRVEPDQTANCGHRTNWPDAHLGWW